MDSAAIASHMLELYEKGTLTDTVINVSGVVFRVHRAILSLSGYFNALLVGSWGPQESDDGGIEAVKTLRFDIDTSEEGDITHEAFGQLLRFLYGKAPQITHENVQQLMVCGSYFDVPSLCSVVADFVFSHLTVDNVIKYTRMVYNREYGEPGKLIEDASIAFIHRNAIDIGASLHALPLVHQRRILLAPELFTLTEFQRYKLAVQMKAACLQRIRYDIDMVGLRACDATASTGHPTPASSPTSALSESSVGGAATGSAVASSTERCELSEVDAIDVEPLSRSMDTRSLAAEDQQGLLASARSKQLEVNTEPVPGSRDFEAELKEVEATYKEIFESIRFLHFSPEQLAEVESDAEVTDDVLRQAREAAAQMIMKLTVANRYNVRRISDFDHMSDADHPDVAAVRAYKWPAFRFGVEVANVFSEAMAPSVDGEPLSTSSERIYFAGSLWCLDLKRYINKTDNLEYVAVYLRRRTLKNTAYEQAKFEDKRDRTTLGFSIRLCGAPGAPTSNSVCGRSQMGKSFGCDSESSWGWETYITTQNLTEKPWSTGDKLRFVMVLDML